jgi:hypothetical protein
VPTSRFNDEPERQMHLEKSMRTVLAVAFCVLLAACGETKAADEIPPAGGGANPFAGRYGAPYSGSGSGGGTDRGFLIAEISATGHIVVGAPGASAGSLFGETDLGKDGQLAVTLRGTGQAGPYTVAYDGTLRLEGTNAFGWGTWRSSSGYTGHWALYRESNKYDVAQTDADKACTASATICTSSGPPTDPAACVAMLPCVFGYTTANGSACFTMLRDGMVMPLARATTAADCPATQSAPPGWAQAGCVADFGACDNSAAAMAAGLATAPVADAGALCAQLNAATETDAGRAATCRAVAQNVAYDMAMVSSSATDADLRQVCQSRYDACAAAPMVGPYDCGNFVPCAATLADFEACWSAQQAMWNASPACDTLTRDQLVNRTAYKLSACMSFQAKCPQPQTAFRTADAGAAGDGG